MAGNISRLTVQSRRKRTICHSERSEESAPPSGHGFFCSYTTETFDTTVEHFDNEVDIGPAEQRLREQDVDGVDAEILFGGAGTGSKHPELRQSFVHAYNGYLSEEYCSAAPDRLLG